jgi:hypothetical protein
MATTCNTNTYYTVQIHERGYKKSRLSRFRKAELQAICEHEGLSTDGTVQILKERLMAGNTCVVQIEGEERLCDLIYIMCCRWNRDDGHIFVLESSSIGNYSGMPATNEHYPELGEKRGDSTLNAIGIEAGQEYTMEYNLLGPTKFDIKVLNVESFPENYIPAQNFKGKWTGNKSVKAKILQDCDKPMANNLFPDYRLVIPGIYS